MGILWAVDHFQPYIVGRQFKVLIDCSSITWLFRSRDLCPKLYIRPLRLAEYDTLLEYRAGVQHVVPDALSRLPHAKDTPADVDASFPDGFPSGAPSEFLGPRGPSLHGVWLADIDAVGGAGAESGDLPSELSSAPPVRHANALVSLPYEPCPLLRVRC